MVAACCVVVWVWTLEYVVLVCGQKLQVRAETTIITRIAIHDIQGC